MVHRAVRVLHNRHRSRGWSTFDRQAVTDENPTYVVFNGAVGALTGDNALQMGSVSGPGSTSSTPGSNLDSNFHPIGSHGTPSTEAAPAQPATAGIADHPGARWRWHRRRARRPGASTIILVDHALARAFDKGAIGQIVVSGDEQPEIFEEVAPGDLARKNSQQASTEAPTRGAGRAGTRRRSTSSRVPARQDLDAPTSSPIPRAPPTTRSTSLDGQCRRPPSPGPTRTTRCAHRHRRRRFVRLGVPRQGDTWSHTFDRTRRVRVHVHAPPVDAGQGHRGRVAIGDHPQTASLSLDGVTEIVMRYKPTPSSGYKT